MSILNGFLLQKVGIWICCADSRSNRIDAETLPVDRKRSRHAEFDLPSTLNTEKQLPHASCPRYDSEASSERRRRSSLPRD